MIGIDADKKLCGLERSPNKAKIEGGAELSAIILYPFLQSVVSLPIFYKYSPGFSQRFSIFHSISFMASLCCFSAAISNLTYPKVALMFYISPKNIHDIIRDLVAYSYQFLRFVRFSLEISYSCTFFIFLSNLRLEFIFRDIPSNLWLHIASLNEQCEVEFKFGCSRKETFNDN